MYIFVNFKILIDRNKRLKHNKKVYLLIIPIKKLPLSPEGEYF